MRPSPSRTGIVLGLVALAGVMVLTLPSVAGLSSVSELFKQGRYDDARRSLQSGGEGSRPGEEVLWKSRLSTDVEAAVKLLESSRTDSNLPEVIQERIALELAEIYFARTDFQNCVAVLRPLIDKGNEKLPGEIYLLAGLAYRLLGNAQTAREMLASVRPSDPAFTQARFYLGDIGLQQGDHSLALRYFESGIRDGSTRDNPDLKAGKWRALRAAGQNQEAQAILDGLQKDLSGSLALLDINRTLREDAEELAARAEPRAEADSTATQPADQAGRYSLQLGAFSDRSLALEFLRRYQSMVADLRIDQVRDQRGQFLYKVRSGHYVNPALARTEAARIKRTLGIDVIVADLSVTTQFSD